MHNKNARLEDIAFVVSKNNFERSIRISAILSSPEVLKYNLGYSFDEFIYRSFKNFLPERSLRIIEENIEYKEGGIDLINVLPKISNFAMVDKENAQVPFKCHVNFESVFEGAERYIILLHREREDFLTQKIAGIKEKLQIAIDNADAANIFEEFYNFLTKNSENSVYNIFRIKVNSEGNTSSQKIMDEAYFTLIKNIRTLDIVFYDKRTQCFYILFINRQSVQNHLAINRIKAELNFSLLKQSENDEEFEVIAEKISDISKIKENLQD